MCGECGPINFFLNYSWNEPYQTNECLQEYQPVHKLNKNDFI